MIRRGRRGSSLVVTFSIIAILVVLLGALQFTGSASRSALLGTEARWQSELEAHNSQVLLAEGLSGVPVDGANASVPQDAAADDQVRNFNVGLDPMAAPNSADLVLRAAYQASPLLKGGGRLFGKGAPLANADGDLPTVSLNGTSLPLPYFTARLDAVRHSNDRALASAVSRYFRAVLQPRLPYAVYAPNGSIKMKSAKAYANPTFEQIGDGEPVAASYLTGLPVNMLAGGGIEVTEDYPYGEAHLTTVASSAKLTLVGGALGTRGFPDEGKVAYADLQSSIEAARTSLKGVAFDKTDTIFGRPMSGVADVLSKLFSGQNLGSFFTLEQASQFYFIIIPQFQTVGGGLLIKLHLPFAPDQSNNSMGNAKDEIDSALTESNEIEKKEKELEKKTEEANELGVKATAQIKKVDDLQSAYDKEAADIRTLESSVTSQQSTIDQLESQLTELEKDSQTNATAIDNVKIQIASAETAIASTKKQLDDLKAQHVTTGDQLAAEKVIRDQLKVQCEAAKKEIEDLNKDIEDRKKARSSNAESAMMGFIDPGEDPGPTLKQEDEIAKKDQLYKDNKGQVGFSYAKLLGRFAAGIIKALKTVLSSFPLIRVKINLGFFSFTIILPDFPKIPAWIASLPGRFLQAMKDFFDQLAGAPVSLVHVGDKIAKPFSNSSTLVLDKNFTVPAGRTFHIRKNLKGNSVNVWVQRGACLVVDGNVDLLTDPSEYLPKAIGGIRRMGMLCLSEGATVIVGGNLTCSAIKLSSPIGKVQGINRAVFCGGTVYSHLGTSSAVTYDELIRYVTGKTGFADGLRDFYEKWIPNLAKLPYLGAFHARKPYFSSYPTQLCVVFFPPCVFPAPLPVGSNIHNTIFKFMSYTFATHLNLAMGDNYYLASRLWKGPVPFLPKSISKAGIDAVKSRIAAIEDAWNRIKSFDFSDLDNLVGDFAKNVLPNMLQKYLPQLLTQVMVQMVAAALPFSDSVPLLDMLLGQAMAAAMDAAFGKGSADPYPGLFGIAQKLFEEAAGIMDNAGDLRAAEVPGVLVYASRIRMGDQPSLGVFGQSFYTPDVTQACGLFVSTAAGNSCEIRCDYTIGACVSLNGDVTAQNLLYYPPFTTVSLYLPRQMDFSGGNPDKFWKQAFETGYGDDIDSKQSLEIPQKPRWYPLSEAWHP